MKVALTKKPNLATKKRTAAAAGAPAPTAFNIQDNGDQTFTVLGVDAAGNEVDIAAVAALDPAPSTDDPNVVTVDSPAPLTIAVHTPTSPAPAVGASTVVHATAKWTDGSVGPFTLDLTFTIQPGPVSGIKAVPGPVAVH